jgi:hypothetical protein
MESLTDSGRLDELMSFFVKTVEEKLLPEVSES